MDSDATQASETLIYDYSKLVFHVIYGLIGNIQESEDLTQETFLQAFRGIDAARASSGTHFQAKAWLLRIAINTVHMSRRRRHAVHFFTFSEFRLKHSTMECVEETSNEAYEGIQEPGDLETIITEREIVQQCMGQLPETLRIPLLLSVVAGFSQSEIATILVLKEATVRQRLTRARKAFQGLYAQACGEHIHIDQAVTKSRKRISRPQNIKRQSVIFVPAIP